MTLYKSIRGGARLVVVVVSVSDSASEFGRKVKVVM